MGIIIGGFQPAQVKQLTANHIAEITPDVIQRMPKETLKSFSDVQMTSFSTNQANAVTDAQYQYLDAAQRHVINKKATVEFKYTPGVSSHLQHLTLTSLLTVVMCAVFSQTS
ncbi:uncharacterized protein LOC121379863 [Gigantopelta aegis]|uniref:uncharacterized protein LOC121379863 n=1 Tax=Gigantopelta aegis TaxID=1735272 RepID=UPI001B88CB09|nr:uncharacterized protein LOC121379863 [Gigantopelta aegis]